MQGPPCVKELHIAAIIVVRFPVFNNALEVDIHTLVNCNAFIQNTDKVSHSEPEVVWYRSSYSLVRCGRYALLCIKVDAVHKGRRCACIKVDAVQTRQSV